jgi:D-sedoheptulose 7-phosphate isomerase
MDVVDVSAGLLEGEAHLASLRTALDGLAQELRRLESWGHHLAAVLLAGGRLLAAGNGGSAAEAQHFAAELVGRFQRHRQPLPALALTTDTSIITSVANDFAYDQVFVRQLEALGRAGDVALAISTSGRSPNVLAALVRARALDLTTIALVGPQIDAIAEIVIRIAAKNTARIQEAHRTALHAICELVEDRFASA